MVPMAIVVPPQIEITHLKADWGASSNATGYEFTYWTSTTTNTITTTDNKCQFTVTNLLDDRVFATVTATNYAGETPGKQGGHWPDYQPDRVAITEATGAIVPVETSINLKQWTASGSTPQTNFFIGSRLYYRSLGHKLIAKPFNPLNE